MDMLPGSVALVDVEFSKTTSPRSYVKVFSRKVTNLNEKKNRKKEERYRVIYNAANSLSAFLHSISSEKKKNSVLTTYYVRGLINDIKSKLDP
jgi:hypothetical protein